MTAIPRYVSTPVEAAARIAGYIFGRGNPEVFDTPLGDTALTCIASQPEYQAECQRCAGVLSWVNGADYRIAANGNFKVKTASLYAALGAPLGVNLYYRALEPVVGFTPSHLQVESFLASVIETQGAFSTNPPKVFEDGRGGIYDQRIDTLVATLNADGLGAFRSGVAVKILLATIDAYPLPLITAATYPGDTPADWPDGPPPPPDLTPPPVPTDLATVSSDAQVSLSWTVVVAADLAGYKVYRDGALVHAGATPAFVDTGLTNGQVYSYQVSSYDTSTNESAKSAAATGQPVSSVVPPPQPPSALSATPGSTSVSLSWTASPSASVVAYRVYRGSALVATVSAPATFVVDSGLVPLTIYTYRVTAIDGANVESTSTPFVSITTLQAVVGPPPITLIFNPIVVQLGCPSGYEVYVADRSGEILLRRLPFTACSYHRVLDDVSTASVTLDLANGADECCLAVAGLARYGFEIVIFREGQRVWTGPVVDILARGENIEIQAEDKMTWLKVRPIWSALDYPDPGEEIATVFNDVVTNAMLPDNVPGLIATAIPTGIRAIRSYTTQPPQIAYDAIQELARTGIDYTMKGPTMIAGSFVVPAAPVAYFTDQSLIELPDVQFLGSNYATQWFVTGDPGQNLLATFGGVDALTGLVVRLATEDTIADQASLNQNAKSRWELTNGPLIAEATLVLDQSAPLPMELAVPGATVGIRFAETCFPLTGTFRLKGVDIDVQAGADAPSEKVSIVVEPIGTELVT